MPSPPNALQHRESLSSEQHMALGTEMTVSLQANPGYAGYNATISSSKIHPTTSGVLTTRSNTGPSTKSVCTPMVPIAARCNRALDTASHADNPGYAGSILFFAESTLTATLLLPLMAR